MKRYVSHHTRNANNHKARRHYRSIMLNAGYEERILYVERNGLIMRYYSRPLFLTSGTLRREDLVGLSQLMW